MDASVEGDLTSVVIDELRLTQVASTFLSNAIKFSSEGGRVGIRVRADGPAMFIVEVTDSGIGIDEKDLRRLFAPFQQLSEGRAKAYQGVGLGLALARRLIESQGGSVGLESRLGMGSTSTFRLPIRPSDNGASKPATRP